MIANSERELANIDSKHGGRGSHTMPISTSFACSSDGLMLGNLGVGSASAKNSCADLKIQFNEDLPAFTLKSVISGILAGVCCTFLALYYGLKVGVTPSLNLLGGVVGYGITKLLMQTGLFGDVFTPQENAVIQTLAVSVYTVACPAFGFTLGWLGLSKESYIALGPTYPGNHADDIVDINYPRSLLWSLSLFSFGFFIAYPLRNYYILDKKLFFPSGTATAYVIDALHTSKDSAKIGLSILAKTCGLAYCVNMFTFMFDGLGSFPIFGNAAAAHTWTLDFDLGQIGIGMLLDLPVNASMLFGALVIYGGLRPWIAEHKDGDFPGAWLDTAKLNGNDYVGLYSYGLFAGMAMMIVQGAWNVLEILIVLVQNWMYPEELEEIVDSYEEKRIAIFSEPGFPLWGSLLGYLVTAGVNMVILQQLLGTKWYHTIIAVLVVPPLACSNIEGMGRTDWDVGSCYGKLMMFPIGALNRHGSIKPCVALCHTTIAGCSNAAILMQDFKTGYLLGARPLLMFLAQILGTFAGCFICPALFALLRSAFVIPSIDPRAYIPGRYGIVYRSLAIVCSGAGFDALPKYTLDFAFLFGGLAIVLNILTMITEKLAPKATKFIPNASAMSIGMLIGAGTPVEFFVGSLIGWWWTRNQPQRAMTEKNNAASGFLAGSGAAVVVQCIASVANFKAPMTVNFATNPLANGHSTAQIVSGVCISLISAGAFFLIAKFYWAARTSEPPAGTDQPEYQYILAGRPASLDESEMTVRQRRSSSA